MGATTEEFIIKITTQAQTSAVSKLEDQIKREQAALAGLDQKVIEATARLKAARDGFGGVVNIAAVRKEQEAIRALKEEIAKKQGDIGKLSDARGAAKEIDVARAVSEAQKKAAKDKRAADAEAKKATRDTEKAAKEAKKAANEEKAALLETSGPMSGFIGKAIKMSEAMGKGGGVAGAAISVAAAIVAMVAAVVVATAAFVTFAVYAADAARSVRLLNDAAAGGRVAGDELSAVVADIGNRVPIATAKLGEMARALEYARLAGRNMQVTLSAMATLAAVVGDSASSKIQQIAESSLQARRFMLGARDIYGEFASLAGTGIKAADVYAALAGSMKVSIAQAKALLLSGRVSVAQGLEALDAAVQAKFGKTVAAQMLALTTQFSKLRENFSKLFDGLDLEPLLRGLKTVTELFSQNTVTGRALRLLATTVLQPIIDAAVAAFPIVRAFFQGMIIGALVVVIVVLRIRKAWQEAFGGDTRSNIDWVKTAMYAGIAAVVGLTGAIVVLTAAFTALAVVGTIVFFPLIAAVVLTVFAIYKIIEAVYAVQAGLAGIDLGAEARNLVDSFIKGLTIDNVVAAMTNLGNAAKNALRAALGIKSPSRVAIDAAQNVTRTFADTVEDGTGDTRAAFAGMVGQGAKGGRAAPARQLPDVHFHYHGGNTDDFEEFKEKARTWFHQELAGLLGEGPIPSAA